MPEITIAGANEISFPSLAVWGWEVAFYLFLGGLVAGLMIMGGLFRLSGNRRFESSATVSDLLGLPLLSIGMLLLLLDLSSRGNVWRLYSTFQVTSPMSWGSWILLLTMAFLAVRFLSAVPAPRPLLTRGDWVPPNTSPGERKAGRPAPSLIRSIALLLEQGWSELHAIALLVRRHERLMATGGILLGVAIGFYTGLLLSSMPARPLWNSAVLAPLFLVSGLASGAAFLCLFMREEEHTRLIPFVISICGIEAMLILAYILNLAFGSEAAQNAGRLLLGGAFGALFWGVVVLVGLLVPVLVEVPVVLRRRVLPIPKLVPPILKLAGGVTLRFVIVYAGMLSFV